MNKNNIHDQYQQLINNLKDKHLQLLVLKDDKLRHDEHEWKTEVKELKTEILEDAQTGIENLTQLIKAHKTILGDDPLVDRLEQQVVSEEQEMQRPRP